MLGWGENGENSVKNPYMEDFLHRKFLFKMVDVCSIMSYVNNLVVGGNIGMWIVFAILSAVFAALTSILAKVGIEGVNSNLATAIRTAVVVIMAWGMVFLTNAQSGLSQISKKSWIFLILSGLATGASWLCYYRALQIGEASKVVPIDKMSVVITLILAFVFLHEEFTAKSLVGCVLISVGTLVMVL
jgi:transporter family protein